MYIDVQAEVNFDDIYYALSKKQKQELLDDLIEDGFKPSSVKQKKVESDFDEACHKMISNAHALSVEEEKIIIDISKKITE